MQLYGLGMGKIIDIHKAAGKYTDIRQVMKDYAKSEYPRGIMVLFNEKGEMVVHHSASNSQLAWAAADLLKRSVMEDIDNISK